MNNIVAPDPQTLLAFHALAHYSPYGMLLLDTAGCIVVANNHIQTILGATDFVNHPLATYFVADDQERLSELSPGTTFARVLTPLGRQVAVQLTAWQLENSDYTCVMVQTQGILPDLRRVTLRDITISVTPETQLNDLFSALLFNIQQFIPHDAANVMLLQSGGLSVVAQRGYENFKCAEWVAQLHLPIEQHPEWQRIMQDAKPHVIPDTQDNINWIPRAELAWVRSVVNLPILVEGRIRGYINLDSSQPHYFSEIHLDYLRFFAHQAATLLHNASSFAAEREQRQLLQALNQSAIVLNQSLDIAEIIDLILANVAQVVPYDTATVMMIEEGILRVGGQRGFADFGLETTVANFSILLADSPEWAEQCQHPEAWVISDTQNTHIPWIQLPEFAWIRSHIHLPLLVNDQIIGLLTLDSQRADFFTHQHLNQLRLFAPYAASAIQNAHLFKQEREQRQFAEILNATIADLGNITDLRQLMESFLDHLQQVIPYDAATIMLNQEGTNILKTVVHRGMWERGLGDWIENQVFSLDYYPIWQKQLRGNPQPKIVYDTHTDPTWQFHSESHWIRSHINIPVFVDNEILGYINLDSTLPNHFTPKHAQFLIPFSHHASVAVKNVRLFEQEREQRLLAEALRDSADALSSTLDLSEVMQRILENVERIVPHDASNIMLVQDKTLRVIAQRGYEKFGQAEWMAQFTPALTFGSIWEQKIKAARLYMVTDTHETHDWIEIPESAWIRAHLSLPIMADDVTLGCLNLDNSLPHSFSPKHVKQLRPFVKQAELAIKNARLFEQEHEQRRLAETLYDIIATLNRSLEPQEVFQRLLENIQRLIPHEAANIMLIEAGVARIVSWHGYEGLEIEEDLTNISFEVATTPDMQEVVTTKQYLLINDLSHRGNWFPQVEMGDWLRSHLKAPIILHDEVVGFLCLDSPHPNRFTPEHARQLLSFAAQAATAIRNAQLHETLQNERKQLQAILDGSGDGILYTEGSKIVYANQALCQLLGYTAEEIQTLPLYRLRNRRAKHNPLFSDVNTSQFILENGKLFARQEVQFYHKEGTLIDVSLTVSRLSTEEERPIRAVIIVRDTRQERQFHEMQTRFIAHAAHELRHPISNLVTRLYLLHRSPNDLEKHLAILESATQRLISLAEHMTIMTDFNLGKLKLERTRVPIKPLLEPLFEEKAREAHIKGLAFSTIWQIAPDYLQLDPTMLTQLLRLLLTDAILHTPAPGQVSVVLDLPDPTQLMIEIHDGRAHIPEHHLALLLQPFYIPSEGDAIHTGLELTIAKHIVDLHQGSLRLQNAPTNGVIFCVKLPLPS